MVSQFLIKKSTGAKYKTFYLIIFWYNLSKEFYRISQRNHAYSYEKLRDPNSIVHYDLSLIFPMFRSGYILSTL